MQANGRLVLVGRTAGHGFATRLLPDGQPDAAFAADTEVRALANATAVQVGDDGAVLVAGYRETDGTVLRLGSGGTLDPSFGDAGRTFIDIESFVPVGPVGRVVLQWPGRVGRYVSDGEIVVVHDPIADMPLVGPGVLLESPAVRPKAGMGA